MKTDGPNFFAAFRPMDKRRTAAKATMKRINKYLRERASLMLVKGDGYFYFRETSDESAWRDVPNSIYVCHMHHLSMEKWELAIDDAVEQWNRQDEPDDNGGLGLILIRNKKL